MLRFAILTLALLASSAPSMAATCSSTGLTVTNVAVKGMTTTGGLNSYQISGVVTNTGSTSQSADTLQSVDIYKGTQKKDSRSIPPLKAGQSYTFTYVAQRSAQAGDGTTHLRFQLDNQNSPNASDANCDATTATVTF